jgi:cell division protein FtsW
MDGITLTSSDARRSPGTRRPGGRLGRTDWGLLLVVFGMLLVGMVMVYSASYGFSLIEGGPYEGEPAYFVKRQAIYAAIGLGMMLGCSRIDYRLYRRLARPILLATVGVLLLTLLVTVLNPGSLGRYLSAKTNSVQLSELAKLGAMVYIAVWLASKGDSLRTVGLGFVPFALLVASIAGLIMMQPDFSTGALLVLTATVMFFVAGAEPKQLVLGGLAGMAVVAVIGFVLIKVVHLAPIVERWDRVLTWIKNPLSDSLNEGFQVAQTLSALNLGQAFGVGLGQSVQKFAIYAPHTDCIIAIIGEEVGFLGTLMVLALYGVWTWRGLRIAWNAHDAYGRFLAVGIVTWVTFGAILHIAVNTATTPFTGDVLPFISSGGSSLVSGLAAVGILLNIARVSRMEGSGQASGEAARAAAPGK